MPVPEPDVDIMSAISDSVAPPTKVSAAYASCLPLVFKLTAVSVAKLPSASAPFSP